LPDWGNAPYADDIISVLERMKRPEF